MGLKAVHINVLDSRKCISAHHKCLPRLKIRFSNKVKTLKKIVSPTLALCKEMMTTTEWLSFTIQITMQMIDGILEFRLICLHNIISKLLVLEVICQFCFEPFMMEICCELFMMEIVVNYLWRSCFCLYRAGTREVHNKLEKNRSVLCLGCALLRDCWHLIESVSKFSYEHLF